MTVTGLCLLLSSCGQTGPLYLPAKPQASADAPHVAGVPEPASPAVPARPA